jgi:hypothetical protein
MTERIAVPGSRRPRAPVFVYLAIATALVVVIGLLPRTGNQTPPPTVAEFAPQASREIKDSIAEQSSRFGSGKGACSGTDCVGGTPPEKKPPKIKVPEVKQCFGDPPRQTQDPQSPPCIPYWKGNNGGATTRGVTENEIIVALPSVAFEDAGEVRRLLGHFNTRYQLYGRHITFAVFTARGSLYAQPDPAQELADAQDVDEKYHAFASLSTGGRYGSEHLFYDELARRHIISVAHRAGTKTSESYFAKFAPYRWSVTPGIDTMQRHIGEFVCKVLKGKPSEYAGPGSVADKRVFGLVHQRAKDGTAPDLDLLRDQLAACGASPPEGADIEDIESSDTSRTSTNTILKLSQAGVTSVICMCDNDDVRSQLMRAASAEQYRPEWILSSYIDNDVDNSFQQAPPDQGTHVLGVTFKNKWLPREQMPWFWAMKDGAPEYDPPAGSGYPLASRYSSLLLLASGIQLAGPNLTPETFQEGLFRAHFPNPGAGGPPYFQARVGFEGGRHTFDTDAAMYWYSRTDRGTVEPNMVGAICYVHLGRRYQLGAWPKEQPAFFNDCRSG